MVLMINNKLTHRLLHYCNPMHADFTSLRFDFTLVTSKLPLMREPWVKGQSGMLYQNEDVICCLFNIPCAVTVMTLPGGHYFNQIFLCNRSWMKSNLQPINIFPAGPCLIRDGGIKWQNALKSWRPFIIQHLLLLQAVTSYRSLH